MIRHLAPYVFSLVAPVIISVAFPAMLYVSYGS